MEFIETEATEEIISELIVLSQRWEAEDSCYGYRKNAREDIEGNRIFIVREGGRIIAYLFGHCYDSENMTSVMEKGTKCFEIEEFYVIPERRDQGIGTKLFRFMEERMDDARFITLSTASKNWKAVTDLYTGELEMSFHSARLFKEIEEKE